METMAPTIIFRMGHSFVLLKGRTAVSVPDNLALGKFPTISLLGTIAPSRPCGREMFMGDADGEISVIAADGILWLVYVYHYGRAGTS
jgi:hypothetical protein